MQGASPIENALRRLNAALDALEGAVDGRLDSGHKVEELESELQRLSLDRSRLAQTLDLAEARSDRIAEANQDVSRRLVTAMETIRSVLDQDGA